MQQQPGEGGLAAAAFADDAERLALAHGERDAVDRLHRLAARALDREMLVQIARDQQRLRRAAAVARIEGADVDVDSAIATSARPSPRAARR